MMTLSLSPEDLSARLETLTRALDDYWIQWRNEYLLQLRKDLMLLGMLEPIVGEVVVIHDEHNPHRLWKLGRVIELITGSGGH